MDLLTHTLSGIGIATVLASFANKDVQKKGIILLCGCLGGALPDIDAISLWSRFDTTIGKFLRLPHRGRDIYFSNYWYSHRNFTHSLLGGVIMTLITVLCAYLIVVLVAQDKHITNFLKRTGIYFSALFFAHLTHLLGDLPTPGGPWGGLKLFWPLTTTIGGTGQLWWWHNDDILLIIFACCVINTGLLIGYHLFKKTFMRYIPVLFVIGSFFLILHQIDQRNFSFAYTGYTRKYEEYDKKSLEIQRKILGKKMYDIMRTMDRYF